MSDSKKIPTEDRYDTTQCRAMLACDRVAGDLVDVCIENIERLKVPYSDLTEAQQRALIGVVERGVREAVSLACFTIAAHGDVYIAGHVKGVTLKGKGEAEAKVTVPLDGERQLTNAAHLSGGPCVIVGVPVEEYLAGLGEREPDPDQRTLQVERVET